MMRIAAIAVALCSFALPGLACDLLGNDQFTIDLALRANDTKAPPRAILSEVRVARFPSDGCSASSCDSTGTIQILLQRIADDGPNAAVGYRVKVAPDSPDTGIVPMHVEDAVLPLDHKDVDWLALAFDARSADISTALEIRTVDAAGNEAEPLRVEIVDPDAGGGCSTTGAPLLALLSFLVRRKRA